MIFYFKVDLKEITHREYLYICLFVYLFIIYLFGMFIEAERSQNKSGSDLFINFVYLIPMTSLSVEAWCWEAYKVFHSNSNSDKTLLVASLMQLVLSRPRESTEVFLIGKLVGITSEVLALYRYAIRRDCCHQFVSRVMRSLSAIPNEFAMQKGLWSVPFPGRNELRKTSTKQFTITNDCQLYCQLYFSKII